MKLILLFLAALAAGLSAQTAPPGDWTDVDVGAVATPGSSSDSNGTVTLAASGADIDGTADHFHFRHVTWTGDGVFITRVNSLTPTHPWRRPASCSARTTPRAPRTRSWR